MQIAPVYPFTADRSGAGGGLALAATFLRQEVLFPLALGIRTECSGMESRAFSSYNEHEEP